MHREIQLLIQHNPVADEDVSWMEGADAAVVDQPQCDIQSLSQLPVSGIVLQDAAPAQWMELEAHKRCNWVCTTGLQHTAQLRDEWKELQWIPRLTVYLPSLSYRFSGKAMGEGFSFYIPDTSAIRGWRVTDGEQSLRDAVQMAKTLGFDALWLHSLDAAQAGRGLELELLDRTADSGLKVWMSGGVTQAQHLTNLTRVGGVDSVVVDAALVREAGVEPLCECLTPRGAEVTPQVSFNCA